MIRKKAGFTLIEVILTLTLIAAISLMMYSFFGQGLSLYTAETTSADKQMNLRQVLSDITNKARLSSPELITYKNGVLTVDTYTYTFADSSVSRNGAILAKGIAALNIFINEGILEIEIIDTSGTRLKTSVSLKR
ncbi:MAG: PulJ/GspJ family protein [Christensenellales bacterium]|jgi:prepilin-type N-terminal cleavage/methylation domain-containing protein